MMKTHGGQHGHGFTLVELLITLVVMAILCALATPPLRAMVVRHGVEVQAGTLAAALRLARATAIQRGQRVTVCASVNAATPNPQCLSEARDWAAGWLIFIDEGGQPGQLDAGDRLLQVQARLPDNDIVPGDKRPSLSFSPTGLALADNNHFQVQPSHHAIATPLDTHRCVILGSTGRVRIQEGPCAS